mgnify:CR=1 FL=1
MSPENIKQIRELPLSEDYLITMFNLQNEVYYVNSSEYNRKLIKKIGHDLISNLCDAYHVFRSFNESTLKPLSERNNMHLLIDFNICLSKALATMIRLMSASNMGRDDIANYYETLLKELKLYDAIFFNKDILNTATQYGRHTNIMDHIYNNPDINLRPSVMGKDVFDNFVKGGRILNPSYFQIYLNKNWELTTKIINALNKLPNDNESDFSNYHLQLMESWLHFFSLLDFL